MNQKELIENLLSYWKENKIFQKSVDQRSDKLQSITYDGPPFASGTPHFGHGLVSAMKDLIGRYKTMQGYKVIRDWGWDCHGLPVEKYVEKKLGLDGKKDIEKIGAEKFVEECRKAVSDVSDEWKWFVDHVGRRANMDNPYFTMDLSYMESVLRVFKSMYDQNLVYKGFKNQRFCPSCATTLANNEVNEGYKDRQDPAITVKFKIQDAKCKTDGEYKKTSDGFIQTTKAIIKDEKGRYLTFFDTRWDFWTLPGGKVDSGESLENALKREILEELGVNTNTINYVGCRKYLGKKNVLAHYFEVTIVGIPKLKEKEKHTKLEYVEIIDSSNELGFAIKTNDLIIDDVSELINRFISFYTIHKVLPLIKEFSKEAEIADVNFLARTTTPRTLPSNMFLAVGKNIHYCLVFDKNVKEYYVIAENLMKQYYKNPDEYILINILKGEDILGIKYVPLFEYINKSKIDQNYKDQFFKIIQGDFVSTDDGTGIVHIAPTFGLDDFEAVAKFLPRQDAKNRLFLSVNDYGEFTDEVPEWKGVRVYEANKDIINKLKADGKLIGQRSYSHSYPHCRRCETPLIQKANTSRFIKEQELTKITVPNVEKIGFVPESVKNRFRDTLQSAPDRNLSRNRYRGAPIPIWENVDDENDKIAIGNLDELWRNVKNGSKNLTKNIFIRHAETIYNPKRYHDSYSSTELNKTGIEQAQELAENLETLKNEDIIIILSPLSRTLQTITPFLKKILKKDEIIEVEKKYLEIQKKYQELRNKKQIQNYLKNPNENKLLQIHEKIYVDYRTTDIILPEIQNKEYPKNLSISKPTNQKLTPGGECMDDVFKRVKEFTIDINDKFATKIIITITHKDTIISINKAFKDFDYITKKYIYSPKNIEINIRYRDNDRKTEVDLHKPYVDNYWFKENNKVYRRIPEVMDCWFESGSMPFGQVGYVGQGQGTRDKGQGDSPFILSPFTFHLSPTKASPLIYPADYIIEGLDQTRGWFRTMHINGNAVMGQNSFNNVIINGLILAEDGKKMSKKLKNYPDPKYLFEKYGADAYRLYLLTSPAVRADTFRFSEKGVEQMFKDFTTAITNAYKFFETYAKVDNFVYDKPTIYFLMEDDHRKTQDNKKEINEKKFVENILRTNPEIIYCSDSKYGKETAKKVLDIMKEYRNQDIEIITTDKNVEIIKAYNLILEKEKGKNVLIINDEKYFEIIWSDFYGDLNEKIKESEIIKLPTYKITNELDKRILAELNNIGIEIENAMENYQLDIAAKSILGFIDRLNNRYIRRSRRRFRAPGMNEDKISAYNTLFKTLKNYVKLCAPFVPFISEHIYLQLLNFKGGNVENNKSVHLLHLPLFSKKYINQNLLEEIGFVRRIISLGLFIRSKNNIKTKQPLQKMEVKI